MFSNKSNDWSTPIDLYDKLNKEFNFDHDPCPLSADFDCLNVWYNWGKMNFVNPPYNNIKAFLEKAISQLEERGNKSVFLIPSRTDTKYFHELIYKKFEIRFIKGRLKFGDHKNSAPFPSMIVIIK